MPKNQESLHDALRTRSGSVKNLTFNGDWVAVFDADGISAGTFNERLLKWINFRLSASHANLAGAQAAFAASKSVTRWTDITSV